MRRITGAYVKPLARAVALVMELMPGCFFLSIAASALHGSLMGAAIYILQFIFDRISAALALETGISHAIIALAAFCLYRLAGITVAEAKSIYMTDYYLGRCTLKLKSRLYKKVAEMEPIRFERSETLDAIDRAVAGVESTAATVWIVTNLLPFYLPYFIIVSRFLYGQAPSLVLSIVIVMLPVLISQLMKTRAFAAFEDSAAPIRRELDAEREYLCGYEYIKDTRIFGAAAHFSQTHKNTLLKLVDAEWKTAKRGGAVDIVSTLLRVAGYAGVLLLFFHYIEAGTVGIGSFFSIFVSTQQIFDVFDAIIGEYFGGMGQNVAAAINYISLLDQAGEDMAHGDEHIAGGIALDNVSFSYPGSAEPALKDVNLDIRAGETIAIVGANGSGKSTLSKIILGIYPPTSGTVRREAARGAFPDGCNASSAMFQSFVKYKLTLLDNITVSSGFDCSEQNFDDSMALAGAGEFAGKLDKGAETVLSREFGGTELSGGQWQRVAIARGLYRENSFISLDEPTSAVDPLEEGEVYRALQTVMKGRTSILVTHRIGAARMADLIVVLENGKIVEKGTHDELLLRNGLYADMFSAQAKGYDINATKGTIIS
jgi:ATP-binding cassette subfamily B protein